MEPAQLEADGWRKFDPPGFSGSVGPYWRRGSGDTLEIGIVAGEHISNRHIGSVHGGALMTFCDVAFGVAVVEALGHARCATTQLQVQFASLAKMGEFVVARPEIVHRTSRMLFMRGLVGSESRTVASAEGIWSVLRAPGEDASKG
ncbi:PaaI family thioesterase [Stakelama tenebrarum]|uniref:PaaI family thioesterase n=1 Tax=Stakelama tenebrarum TaxID=2711215 RepID=A0A6G6Y788_9SPHN|nr:PaaI family thioesterase [Sphingosinithalassobacter tenebrarum]QIG80780.1 PaaI family thioesterase [Sphingosinithalassobacter tenebrarum]